MDSVTRILWDKYNIKAKAGTKIDCPFCGKHKFSIKDDDTIGKCFHPDCEKHIGTKKGGGGISSSKNKTILQAMGCTLAEYSTAKKLPIEFLQKLGLKDITVNKRPALKIPYYDEKMLEIATRHRIEMKKGEFDNRFRWKTGTKIFPYGLWRMGMAKKKGYIVIVEGESDCHTLWFHDILAVGIPGASAWNEAWASYFDGIGKIYTVIEPDAGGKAVQRWLAKSKLQDRIFIVDLGEYEDPSGLHVADPDKFDQRWADFLEFAVPWERVKAEQEDRSKAENWNKCKTIAHKKNILDAFYADLLKCGFVGEERATKLLYLTLTSRLLDRPISVTIKGPSSGGKSFIVKCVVKFFPASAYIEFTAMSEKALVYSEESFEHRFIIIFEVAGVQGDIGSYLVRSLMSENCMKYEFVEKTKDGLKNRRIEKEGPTGFIMTTTAIKLHPENETRILSIPINDTKEHTRKILLAMAQEEKKIDFSQWHAFQQLKTGTWTMMRKISASRKS